MNITDKHPNQTQEQVYGMEHVAIETDDLSGAVARLTESGARILEETTVRGGRRVCYFDGPESVCLEVLEKSE